MKLPFDPASLVANPGLQSVWVDHMRIAVRGDIPVATLRFFTTQAAPDVTMEACRIQIPIGLLKNMVDVISSVVERYPTQPVAVPDPPKTARKRKAARRSGG